MAPEITYNDWLVALRDDLSAFCSAATVRVAITPGWNPYDGVGIYIIPQKIQYEPVPGATRTKRAKYPVYQAQVFGLDFSVNMLERAREIAHVVRGDAEYLPFKDSSFDKCHSAGLLAVYRSKRILEEAGRVTRKGGRLFFSFPAAESVSGVVTRLFLKVGINVSLFDVWYGRKDIERMLPEDLEAVKIARLGFEPPFQRLFKHIESKKLCVAFRYLEARLRDRWLFTYFRARHFLEAKKR